MRNRLLLCHPTRFQQTMLKEWADISLFLLLNNEHEIGKA